MTSHVIPLKSFKMTFSLSIKSMLIVSSSLSDSSKELEESSWLSYGITLESLILSGVKSVIAFAYEDQACMQKRFVLLKSFIKKGALEDQIPEWKKSS